MGYLYLSPAFCVSPINGHSRILNWRYLPYIRPIFQAYVRGYTLKIWPNMVLTYLHQLDPEDLPLDQGSVWLGFKKFRVGMPWCLALRCPCLVLSMTLLAVFGLIGLGVTSAPIVLNTDFETRFLKEPFKVVKKTWSMDDMSIVNVTGC